MKIFKLLLALSVIITISYFSWDYYAGKLMQEKREKAILVFEKIGGEYYAQKKV